MSRPELIALGQGIRLRSLRDAFLVLPIRLIVGGDGAPCGSGGNVAATFLARSVALRRELLRRTQRKPAPRDDRQIRALTEELRRINWKRLES